MPDFTPPIPISTPSFPPSTPVIPAKAGIQTAANAAGTLANKLRQHALGRVEISLKRTIAAPSFPISNPVIPAKAGMTGLESGNGERNRGLPRGNPRFLSPFPLSKPVIPAFAGMTGLEIGNDGAAIVRFRLISTRPRACWRSLFASVPAAFAAVWIPAFAGMTGVEGGNDGVEIGIGGVKSGMTARQSIRFSLMSTRPRTTC